MPCDPPPGGEVPDSEESHEAGSKKHGAWGMGAIRRLAESRQIVRWKAWSIGNGVWNIVGPGEIEIEDKSESVDEGEIEIEDKGEGVNEGECAMEVEIEDKGEGVDEALSISVVWLYAVTMPSLRDSGASVLFKVDCYPVKIKCSHTFCLFSAGWRTTG